LQGIRQSLDIGHNVFQSAAGFHTNDVKVVVGIDFLAVEFQQIFSDDIGDALLAGNRQTHRIAQRDIHVKKRSADASDLIFVLQVIQAVIDQLRRRDQFFGNFIGNQSF